MVNHVTLIAWSGANPGGTMRGPEREQGRKKRKMKLREKTTATLLIAIFMISTFAVATVIAEVPIIDGVFSTEEWGTPLGTAVDEDNIHTVTMYAHATMDALYLAFVTNDATDNRGGSGLDVLDFNIGLVGDEVKLPWRYVLVTKIYADSGWGDQWDAIDHGYYGSWADTWITGYYSYIPAGIEMVTSFATGYRVTEFKVPMSIMFDGEHGWEGPNGGETLLLAGTSSGEVKNAFVPQGIDHGDETTYATIEIPLPTKADILRDKGVPGKGIDKAPGLGKAPPNDNFAEGE